MSMLTLIRSVNVLLLAAGFAVAQAPEAARSLAPYVASPQPVVEKMLEAAELKPNEVVYDLGSGDGRVLITAAQRFRAKAVGIELSPKLVKAAERSIRDAGLADRCRVVQGDLLEADLSEADVVTIYLLTSSNERLRPNLEKYLKAGARVVSHDFEIRGWKPERIVETEAHKRVHRIYVYYLPQPK